MQLITLENHPPSVAVIKAGKQSAKKLAERVKALLNNPTYSSVVVLRDTKTLTETFQRTARNKSADEDIDTFFEIDGEKICDSNSDEEYTREKFTEKFGEDYSAFANFVTQFGARSLVIRNDDGPNGTIHLDTEASRGTKDGATILPAGVTVTMSAGGGGTYLVDADRSEFKKVREDRKLVWAWTGIEVSIPAEKMWGTPDGAFVAMKCKAWVQGKHTPCLHRSPPRERNGDVNERNVSVSFVRGRK